MPDKASCSRDLSGNIARQNSDGLQHLKRFMIVFGGWLAAFGGEMVINVDHPADHPLKIPFGEHFVDGTGEIALEGFVERDPSTVADLSVSMRFFG